jgi:hypothetical protein
MLMKPLPPLIGKNVALGQARLAAGLSRMDDENSKLRNSGFNLQPAVAPTWDRQTWEAYRAQFGEYPFGPNNKPPDLDSAPPWVKQICGVRLNPAGN